MNRLKNSVVFVICLVTGTQGIICCHTGNKTGERPVKENTDNPPTSEALPSGMELVWSDEFNGTSLDRDKWFTDYYSTI